MSSQWSMFQSTHPRGVRHCLCFDVLAMVDVSIHAPAGGATGIFTSAIETLIVSIHAPAGGATTSFWRSWIHQQQFQSTHPRGVRQHHLGFHQPSARVSIHAPAGGATRVTRPSATIPVGFNPRTRGGCDQQVSTIDSRLCCFNPRTRGGCDFVIPGPLLPFQ